MAKPKKFTTYLNNMLCSGANYAVRSEHGMLFARWTTTTLVNMRSDLHIWKYRIAVTKVDRRYWGQE